MRFCPRFSTWRRRRCRKTMWQSPPRRCRASASPNRSNSCATRPTKSWPRPARGRMFSWRRSARPPTSTPRATFAKNFFEAGGIEAVSSEEGPSPLAAAFKTSGAALACLCGSDKTYDSEAEAAAAALKAAGARHIYLAGRPGETEDHLSQCRQPSSTPVATRWRRCGRRIRFWPAEARRCRADAASNFCGRLTIATSA